MGPLINSIDGKKINLEGYTLIIPTVSVGNIGQLTVDLLLSTFEMEKIASLWHSAIVPCVGSDPIHSESSEVCTACELYVQNEKKLAAIQMRSTLEFELALEFLTVLKQEIVKWKISKVVILTSTFAHEMHNINLSPFVHLSNNSNLEKQLSETRSLEPNENGKYFVYGSGFALKLFELLSEETNCIVLIKYTSEGDNRPDALQMLNLINKFLDSQIKQIKVPISWQYAFGNPPPMDIY